MLALGLSLKILKIKRPN